MDDQVTSPKWADLRGWLAFMKQRGLVHEIEAVVDPIEELSAITFLATQRLGAKAPALLFKSLLNDRSGSAILTNMLAASQDRYALTVGLDPDLSLRELVASSRGILARREAPRIVDWAQAPISEVTETGDKIDLTRFPVPKFWPGDGGQFIGTGNVTINANPSTGLLNAGVYRQQLHGPAAIGMCFAPGRHGLTNCESYWKQGKAAPLVIAYGAEPELFLAATQNFPDSVSEIDVAGGIKGSPINMTRAPGSELLVPADAEFVIEGEMHEGDVMAEGPLGEFHGFYSDAEELRPVIRVKAVHRRRSPILTAALMANYPSCEIGAYHAIMRSGRIIDNLKSMGVPGVESAYAHPSAASGYGLVVVSLEQMYPGHASQVLALTSQCPAAVYSTKWIIAVDSDIDPSDIDQVMWALTTRADPSQDIDVLRNTYSFFADTSLAPEARPYGSKALINACVPHRYRDAPPVRALLAQDVYHRVVARWDEFGFDVPPVPQSHFHRS